MLLLILLNEVITEFTFGVSANAAIKSTNNSSLNDKNDVL